VCGFLTDASQCVVAYRNRRGIKCVLGNLKYFKSSVLVLLEHSIDLR